MRQCKTCVSPTDKNNMEKLVLPFAVCRPGSGLPPSPCAPGGTALQNPPSSCCFHGFFLPPFSSFLFETALRPPDIDRLLRPPRRRSHDTVCMPHHIPPSQKISRSTAPPSPLDSSARLGALPTVSGIADSWNLLELTCLVMGTASMLTRSTEAGVCRHVWSQTIAQKAPIQFYDLATQLTPWLKPTLFSSPPSVFPFCLNFPGALDDDAALEQNWPAFRGRREGSTPQTWSISVDDELVTDQ